MCRGSSNEKEANIDSTGFSDSRVYEVNLPMAIRADHDTFPDFGADDRKWSAIRYELRNGREFVIGDVVKLQASRPSLTASRATTTL